MEPNQIDLIKKRHNELKGPFGFCGLRTTIDCLNEYTEFCSVAVPELTDYIAELERKLAVAKDTLELICVCNEAKDPIVDLRIIWKRARAGLEEIK